MDVYLGSFCGFKIKEVLESRASIRLEVSKVFSLVSEFVLDLSSDVLGGLR